MFGVVWRLAGRQLLYNVGLLIERKDDANTSPQSRLAMMIPFTHALTRMPPCKTFQLVHVHNNTERLSVFVGDDFLGFDK